MRFILNWILNTQKQIKTTKKWERKWRTNENINKQHSDTSIITSNTSISPHSENKLVTVRTQTSSPTTICHRNASMNSDIWHHQRFGYWFLVNIWKYFMYRTWHFRQISKHMILFVGFFSLSFCFATTSHADGFAVLRLERKRVKKHIYRKLDSISVFCIIRKKYHLLLFYFLIVLFTNFYIAPRIMCK